MTAQFDSVNLWSNARIITRHYNDCTYISPTDINPDDEDRAGLRNDGTQPWRGWSMQQYFCAFIHHNIFTSHIRIH
jgi:hypothetical protein